MNVTCQNCTTRLQLDDAKIPAHPFTVRCPKCQQVINAQPPPAASHPPQAVSSPPPPPPTEQVSAPVNRPAPNPHVAAPPAAPPVSPSLAPPSPALQPPVSPSSATPSTGEGDALLRMLTALMQQVAGAPGVGVVRGDSAPGGDWEKRRALVCVRAAHVDGVTRALAGANYAVTVAEGTAQAIDRMRVGRMSVIVLDAEFDSVEQGAAFIQREIDVLRPAARRRLFVVRLTPTAETADAHAAFLDNVNLVINPTELEELSEHLDRNLRDFNELYRDFNKVLSVAGL
ncbi:MAG: zinc-ribbon domain-containing protein [Acidobacteriota bacterium]|nr:zinc-ribbon domain-containing protein [Acidobacteriota bacterium]